MSPLSHNSENWTGSLLVAHPTLMDPHFRRTIVFLSHHSKDDGATGFVLNRPLDEEISPGELLDRVPVFYGGPVQPDLLVLATLQWRDFPSTVAFRTFATPEEAAQIEPDWQPGLRAFAGYAGWSAGQLENEVADEAWLILPPTRRLFSHPTHQGVWQSIMREQGPLMHLLSLVPDRPEKN